MQKDLWENFYKNRKTFKEIPSEKVVMALYHNIPQDKDKSLVNILDMGCGSSANIIYAASQGYNVAGIDISDTAIEYSKRRFEEMGLKGDLRIGNFFPLNFKDNHFDFVIDSGGLTCVSLEDCGKAVDEIHRVLKPSGRFLFMPRSDGASSAASGVCADGDRVVGGFRKNITIGLTNYGSISFHSSSDIQNILNGKKWKIIYMKSHSYVDYMDPNRVTDVIWEIVAEKL